MDGSVLEENSSFTMLELIFSCKEDCGYYIISIAKTAFKKIGALIRYVKFLSPEVALYLYPEQPRPLFGESDLVGWGIVIRIERFPVQTQLGAQPSLGTQPCYKAPDDLRVKYVKCKWLTSSEWGCLLNNGPRLAVGQPNSS